MSLEASRDMDMFIELNRLEMDSQAMRIKKLKDEQELFIREVQEGKLDHNIGMALHLAAQREIDATTKLH